MNRDQRVVLYMYVYSSFSNISSSATICIFFRLNTYFKNVFHMKIKYLEAMLIQIELIILVFCCCTHVRIALACLCET